MRPLPSPVNPLQEPTVPTASSLGTPSYSVVHAASLYTPSRATFCGATPGEGEGEGGAGEGDCEGVGVAEGSATPRPPNDIATPKPEVAAAHVPLPPLTPAQVETASPLQAATVYARSVIVEPPASISILMEELPVVVHAARPLAPTALTLLAGDSELPVQVEPMYVPRICTVGESLTNIEPSPMFVQVLRFTREKAAMAVPHEASV